MTALFASIISSHIEHDELASLLDVLSKADIIVGRANARREWRLLSYVSGIIGSRAVRKVAPEGDQVQPVRDAVVGHGTDICPLAVDEEDPRRACAGAPHFKELCWLVCPDYFIRLMTDEKVNPVEFAIDNFGDWSVGESIAREMEKAKGNERLDPAFGKVQGQVLRMREADTCRRYALWSKAIKQSST